MRVTSLRGFGVGTQYASVQMAVHVAYYQLDLGVERLGLNLPMILTPLIRVFVFATMHVYSK